MEKVRLGRTNLMVSNIGFGGIPIQRLTEAETIAVVRRALDLGVNFIDTANNYTTSEERIRVLKMVQEGKITPEMAADLLKALDSSSKSIPDSKYPFHFKKFLQRYIPVPWHQRLRQFR